jgi:hypothetical protein
MSRPRAKAPRIFVCTSASVITVNGTGPHGVGLRLTAGAQVDFDQVIGDGPDGPCTLEQALGPYTETCFRPASPAPLPHVAQDDEE